MTKTAVLLAAGYGSRISELTTLPKCLLSVGGSTILERHLTFFQSCGIEEVKLVVGYKKDHILDHIKPFHSQLNISICENIDFKEKGNTYSMYLGLKHVNTDVIILDADLVYSEEIMSRYLQDSASNSLIVGPGSEKDVESTKVLIDSQKQVRLLVDKREITSEELNQYAFMGEAMGMIRVSKASLPDVMQTMDTFFKTDIHLGANWELFINIYLQSNGLSAYFEPSKQWVEIDTRQDYQAAEILFKSVTQDKS
ncbi:MAG: phosphocholine cytidylyltransferase family protein [Candidatus Margulisbacteria bacterium]|nr:phosphocholine cytidylyltransferase family protein [Candidatus Margulisiibacteriota bacterium]